METVPALSIRQPWAWLICHPEIVTACGISPKQIENRDWLPPKGYRGPLLIHTGRNVDEEMFLADLFRGPQIDRYYWEEKFGDVGQKLSQMMPQSKDDYARGAIIGMAMLTGVVTESDSPWFCGRYGFVLKDARAFEKPVPYRGSLKLFDIPIELVPESMLPRLS